MGQHLQIRLLVPDNPVSCDVGFDDVKLTANPGVPFPVVHTVTLTLAVSDEGNPTPVTDSMTIDVYDDACKAAIGAGATYDETDIDKNCITDLKDLAALLAEWLVDNALTTPEPK